MEFWVYDHSANTRRTVQAEGKSIEIGRDERCGIVLKGAFVAKRHARIALQGNQFTIEALGRSGTRVANREVPPGQKVKLDFGDEVQIAQFSIALVRPGRSELGPDHRAELHRKLMGFEQRVHAELIERLNLRASSSMNKSDRQYVAQVLLHLEHLLEQSVEALEDVVRDHAVHEYLHRLAVAEVVRQSLGKVQTDYTPADERLLDAKREQAIQEIVSSMVDLMLPSGDPTLIQEDLAHAEVAFEDLFKQVLGSIPRGLRSYMIRRTISKDLQDIMFGFGPLQDLLEMANVSEVMVVGKDRIYVEKNGVIQPTTRSFFSDEVLLSVIERILAPIGRRVDTSTPLVDARLPDGSRVNIIISPLSMVGPCVTIRKFGWIPFTIDDLIERGTISSECAAFLQGCVIGRKNIVISGGTGSGKTTLLNTLSAYCRPAERILTIEESAELKLPQPHVVSLEGRPANVEGRGAYTIRELVRNALRMRPDRIIVGEVRGPECLDMLQAMNTGHDGSLSTLHANTPLDATKRMETMVLMAVDMPVRAIREQIVSAVDLVVQLTRYSDGKRRVSHISEVVDIHRETHEIRLEDIFILHGPSEPRMRHTGYIPTFANELIDRKVFDVDVFL